MEEKRARAWAKSALGPKEPSRPSAGAASSSSDAAAIAPAQLDRRRKTPRPHAEIWSASDASAFLPAGATSSKETTYHVRWKGRYKDKLPPNVASKSNSEASSLSDESALIFVLSQLWRWHTERTAEDCP